MGFKDAGGCVADAALFSRGADQLWELWSAPRIAWTMGFPYACGTVTELVRTLVQPIALVTVNVTG